MCWFILAAEYEWIHSLASLLMYFQGESPYLRATYRYSPLLAIALQPNIFWTVHFGKFVFILFDLLTGYLIFNILQSKQASQTLSVVAAGLWIFNPISATVSVRGNAESIMSFLVLICLKFLIDRHIFAAGFVYALSIHFKIYPVTYALAIYLFLGRGFAHDQSKVNRGEGHYYGNSVTRIREIVICLLPNRDRLVFASSSVVTLVSLTSVFYLW